MAAQGFTPFHRVEDAPLLPPPPSEVGVRGWIHSNILSSMTDFSSPLAGLRSVIMAVMTVVVFVFAAQTIWALMNFALFDAVWTDPEGLKREACLDSTGACWPFVYAKWKQFIYGRYPDAELWRVNIIYFLGAVGIAWLVIDRMPYRRLVVLLMLLVFPPLAFILLTGANLAAGIGFWQWWLALTVAFFAVGSLAGRGYGGEVVAAFAGVFVPLGFLFAYVAVVVGLATVDWGLVTDDTETANWGGLLVTLVVAVTGIVASLPIGILLALGRRSQLPAVRLLCVVFIEFWRGVPLITVLFMSSVMLPLFLPEGTDFNKLLRALIGVAMFSAAYMAEVVRGGLQAIGKGQYEGAQAVGLQYWQMMRLIVLPQALTLVIPGIVNTFIGLFKDTTLVLIIGLFDLLGIIQFTFTDASWSTPVTVSTGYLVAGLLFWLFCFGMSRYSMRMERQLRRGRAY